LVVASAAASLNLSFTLCFITYEVEPVSQQQEKTIDELKIRFRYVTLVTGLFLTAVAVLAYIKLGRSPEIEGAMAIFAAGVALTALTYTAMNIHLVSTHQKQTLTMQAQAITIQQQAIQLQTQAIELQNETTNFNKKMRALDIVNQWNSPEIRKLTLIADDVGRDIENFSPKELADLLQNNKDKYMAAILTLNFLENMSLAIRHKLADEQFLKDFFKLTIRFYFSALKGIIDMERKTFKSNQIFNEIEDLLDKWS
jgi:hypothetical protein